LDKELESLLNLSVYEKVLDGKYLEILNYLLTKLGISSSDLYKSLKDIAKNNKKPWYKTIWRNLDELHKLNLIEVHKENYLPLKENNGKDRIPFRLSLNGIFYIILNNVVKGFYDEIVLPLMKNYGSSILFTHFLYPFISKETLLDIEKLDINDRIIYEHVFSYLQSIFSTIIKSLKSMDSLIYSTDKDGFIMYQIFMWPHEGNPP